MAKGYDPYNKSATKAKKPEYAKANSNNPYNNAGSQVKGSGPKGVSSATNRAVSRTSALGGSDSAAANSGYKASAGQSAKVPKTTPKKFGWAKASGPKAGGVSGQGIPSKPGGAMVKWGTGSTESITAKVVNKLPSAARFAGAVAVGTAAMEAVAYSAGMSLGDASKAMKEKSHDAYKRSSPPVVKSRGKQ
jgi:hypothetical protein